MREHMKRQWLVPAISIALLVALGICAVIVVTTWPDARRIGADAKSKRAAARVLTPYAAPGDVVTIRLRAEMGAKTTAAGFRLRGEQIETIVEELEVEHGSSTIDIPVLLSDDAPIGSEQQIEIEVLFVKGKPVGGRVMLSELDVEPLVVTVDVRSPAAAQFRRVLAAGLAILAWFAVVFAMWRAGRWLARAQGLGAGWVTIIVAYCAVGYWWFVPSLVAGLGPFDWAIPFVFTMLAWLAAPWLGLLLSRYRRLGATHRIEAASAAVMPRPLATIWDELVALGMVVEREGNRLAIARTPSDPAATLEVRDELSVLPSTLAVRSTDDELTATIAIALARVFGALRIRGRGKAMLVEPTRSPYDLLAQLRLVQ